MEIKDAVFSINSNDSSDYYRIIETLKNQFYLRYVQTTPSTNDGLENFHIVCTLGAGAFGRVFLVETDKQFFAMKCLSKEKIIRSKEVKHTFSEKRILNAIRYPFIINLEYSFKDNKHIYFIMPFVNGGDMFHHLRKMKRFSESLSRFLAAQVLLAVEFLHFCDIVHRDLKPENILIDSNGYIKVADLGFCKRVKTRTYTLCGTPQYIAPEIILNKGSGKAADWWAFGILLFEMNAGYPPFDSSDPLKLYSQIVACKFTCPTTFSYDLRYLIENIIQVDLSRRLGNLKNGIRDLKHHAWFDDIDYMNIYYQQIEAPFKPRGLPMNIFGELGIGKLSNSLYNCFEEEFAKF